MGGEGVRGVREGEEKLSVLRRRRKRRRRIFCGRAHGRAGQSKVVQEVLVDPKKFILNARLSQDVKLENSFHVISKKIILTTLLVGTCGRLR